MFKLGKKITEQIWKRIMHVPSLIRDSPSISELNFLEAPASLSKAKTATVSVHDTIEPKRNAPVQV